MFHKVKNVTALPNYMLSVQFCVGITKLYNVKKLFTVIPAFRYFEKHTEEFYDVYVDVGGYGIVWNDDIDLSCDELWDNGKEIKTPFDNLISFHDATE